MRIVPDAHPRASSTDARPDIARGDRQGQAEITVASLPACISPIAIDFGGPALAMFECRCGYRWRIFRRRDGSWPAIERCDGCRTYCPERAS